MVVDVHSPKVKAERSDLKSQAYAVDVTTTLSVFAGLESEWEALAAASGVTQFNASFSWQYGWAKNFSPDELFIITVRNNAGRLVGLFPLKRVLPDTGLLRRKVKHLQFIGTEPCLYEQMAVLINLDEPKGAVLDAFASFLLERADVWDFMDLRFVQDKELLETLIEKLAPGVHRAKVVSTMSAPYMALPDSMETYLTVKAHRSKRQRYKRSLNTLKRVDETKEPWLCVFESGTTEATEHLDKLMDQHIAYWAERDVDSNFSKYPATRDFYHELLNHKPEGGATNRCVFSALMFGDTLLSYEFGFSWDGTENYLYNIGAYYQEERYMKASPGQMHAELLARRAVDLGHSRVYFGRGDEPYKASWCKGTELLWNTQIYRTPSSYALIQGDEKLKKLFKKESVLNEEHPPSYG